MSNENRLVTSMIYHIYWVIKPDHVNEILLFPLDFYNG